MNKHLVRSTAFVLTLTLSATVFAQGFCYPGSKTDVNGNPCDAPNERALNGCGKDTDCKGDRICQSGQCTSPPKTVVKSVPLPVLRQPTDLHSSPYLSPVPPSKGTGYLIAGGILFGLGASTTAVGGLMVYQAAQEGGNRGDSAKTTAIGITIIGGVQAFLGFAFLITGATQHSNYTDWQEQHKMVSGITPTGYQITF